MTTSTNLQNPTTEDFAALFADFSQDTPQYRDGDIVKGYVLEVAPDYVLIDIGGKSEGRIPISEFRDIEGKIQVVNVGDTIEVKIIRRIDDDGQCEISKEAADHDKIWNTIEEKAEKEELVRGRIISRVKGGLQVDIGVKAFLPGSQVELRPTRNLDKYIDEEFAFKIIKFSKTRDNIVLSRRALLENERIQLKTKTLSRLYEGAVIEGIVKNITDYGAFVDLGGIDGLLHITDMSWGRVAHPSEVFQVGDEIQVKVLKFNADSERVSLGYKQLTPDPWEGAGDRYPKGVQILGRVVSLIEYGAFVELEEGIEGLVHISEMSWTKRINHPSRVVHEGQIIDVVVLSLDPKDKKVSLGMKQIEPNPWSLLEERYPVGTIILGRVRNITDFGVFIGIEDGIDGLVHITDISWTRKIRQISDLYQRGDEVESVVLNIDVENERFSLGIKQLEPDPWDSIPLRYPPGKIVDARITKLTEFGAFAEIEEGVEGLIHISELSEDRIDDPSQVVKTGEKRKAEVISIDPRERKIALSIKSFVRRSESGELREYSENTEATAQLGDLLKDQLGDIAASSPKDEE